MQHMAYVLLGIYLLLAVVLQLLMGDFPVSLFSFPLNVILLVLWSGAVFGRWKNRRNSSFVRFMLSSGATVSAIGLTIIFCLVIGITGWRWLTGTWPFIFLLIYFQTVLLYVIIRGWRRLRFFLLHVGLLTATGSAFWGAPDSETLRLQAYLDTPVSEAFRMDGKVMWMNFEVIVTDFEVELDSKGMPSDYSAEINIGGNNAVLKVNHPYSVNFATDLYLSGYDQQNQEYCILQVVREPWKYGVLAGIIMMLAGAFLLFISGPSKRLKE